MRALGLMSGTSMDGVDAAVLETDGETIAGFGPSAFAAYGAEDRALLRGALGEVAGGGGARGGGGAGAGGACGGGGAVRRGGSRWVSWADAGARAAGAGDASGRGGGTGWRGRWGCRWSGTFAPRTWRAGARGRRWCRSFTSPARGGSGAEAPVAFLNLGGVGNVTWVDPRQAGPEAEGALVAFDTGPGNALIDDFLGLRLGRAFDEDGAVAAAGRVRRGGAGGAGGASVYRKDAAEVAGPAGFPCVPGSGGRAFDRGRGGDAGGADGGLRGGGGAAFPRAGDAVAGLRRRAAEPGGDGGCWRQRTNAQVAPVEAVGLDGDMLEAQAFAYLAVRVLRGLPTSGPATTGVRLPVSGGRISRPSG